ncbi:MAG: cell envelope biogenesis protein AsmA [Candidatus Scalindua sp.]|nr:MAG: cell envelope biogenesis protein AsmA [Candidatus Scalindua sp.]
MILSLIVGVYVLLTRYDCEDLKPLISKATLDATGRELTIGGDINLDIGFRPTIVLTDIKFQNALWGSRPELVKIKRFEIQVALFSLITGKIKIKRCVVIEPNVLLETDESGRLNFESISSTGKIKLPAVTINNIRVVRGRLSFKDGKSGKAYKILLKSLTAKAEGFYDLLEISSDGGFKGESFQVRGTLGPVPDMLNSEKDCTIDLTFKAFDITAKLKGSLKDPLHQRGLDLGFTIQAFDFTKLSKVVGRQLPLNEELQITGRISDVKPKSYQITDCGISLGGNRIEGLIEIDLSNKRPYFSSNLSSDNLDLRPLLSQLRKGGVDGVELSTSETKAGKLFSSTPLQIDVLTKVDGTATIKIKKLLLPRLALNNVSSEIVTKNDTLIVRPINATIGGGSLNGHVNLEILRKDAVVNTQFKANGVDLESMLKDLGMRNVMVGDLDVDILLSGQGASVANIMENIDGHVSVILGDGQILNKYIELLGSDLRTSVYRLLNPFKEKEAQTDIRCMVGRFDIENGLAKSSVLLFDTEHMCVVGGGESDLRQERLNISLKPIPKEGLGTQATGKFSLNLGELAKPFKLGGTLSDPSLTLDTKQTVIAVGKAIGGIALFGPFGIVAALIGKNSDDQNPCLAAIEIAKGGVNASLSKELEKKKSSEKSVPQSIMGVGESIGNSFEKLFGKEN